MKKLVALIIVFSLFLVPFEIYADETVNLIVKTDEAFDMESFKACGFGKVTNIYKEIFSGFSIETYEKYIDEIKEFKGVSEVFEDRVYTTPEIMPSEEDVFSFFSEQNDYLGEGAVIAVIDSSFNVNHEIFSLSADTSVKYEKKDIASVLSLNELNAEAGYNTTKQTLTEDLLYKSDKIPFAFDYAGRDTEVKSSVYHGNAVAGIVGGNSAGYKGVLPQAQLVLMKVGNDSGGISDSWIFAAFEDAYLLGVDAVNLSMGAIAGYSDGALSGYPIGELISALNDKGIVVSVAAGNDGILNSEGLPSNKYGLKYPFAETTDYGLVSSPASAPSAIAVAAADMATGAIASFSSRGVTPDLILKPEISAKGTSYRIANVSGYDTGSGTSFASPEVCAKTVIIKKELESRGYTGDKLSQYTKRLMINTADVLRQSDDIAITPRAQGAGYINTNRAIAAKAVMYAKDGSAVLSLKDKLSGSFEISFNIENISGETVTYNPSLELITDGYSGSRINGKSVSVPHTVVFNPASVTVAAGETKTVTVTVDMDDSWLADNSEVFKNGFYLDGYIFMDTELSIPFTGYYGDWLKSPVFISDKQNFGFGFATYFVEPSAEKPAEQLFYLGNNFFKGNTAYSVPDSSKVAFSPNGDKSLDVACVYLGLYRNLSRLTWMIKDSSGNIIFGYNIPVRILNKARAPHFLYAEYLCWDGKDSDKNKYPDGQYVLYAEGVLDYGDGAKVHICERPIYLDTQAPELTDFSLCFEDGKKYLEFNINDNHHIQVAAISDSSGNVIGMNTDVTDETCCFDITGSSGDFVVESADYALNFAAAEVTVADEYIAFYDSNGVLLRVKKNETVLVDGTPISDYENISLNENEAYAKIMIWDKNMKPLYYKEK